MKEKACQSWRKNGKNPTENFANTQIVIIGFLLPYFLFFILLPPPRF